MCLVIVASVSQAFEAKYAGKKRMTAYKILNKQMNGLESVCYQKLWVCGTNKSSRSTKELSSYEKCYREVYEGIHVFLNKKDAESYRKFYANGQGVVIVPVRCNLKDLIAAGVHGDDNKTEHAVFMKVSIEKKTWDKVTK